MRSDKMSAHVAVIERAALDLMELVDNHSGDAVSLASPLATQQPVTSLLAWLQDLHAAHAIELARRHRAVAQFRVDFERDELRSWVASFRASSLAADRVALLLALGSGGGAAVTKARPS